MPDWTYLPLRPVADRLLGPRRARAAAFQLLGGLARLPGGTAMIAGLGHSHPPAEAARRLLDLNCPTPVGATISTRTATVAGPVLEHLGVGLVEVGPVTGAHLAQLRPMRRRSHVPIAVRMSVPAAAAAIADQQTRAALIEVADLLVIDLSDDPDGNSTRPAGQDRDALLLEPLTRELAEELARADGPAVLAGLRARAVTSDRMSEIPGVVDGFVIRGEPAAVATAVAIAANAGAGRPVLADCPAANAPSDVVLLLDAGASLVLLSRGVLESGPGLWQRCIEQVVADRRRGIVEPPDPTPPGPPGISARVRGIPAWVWATPLGLGMTLGGLGAVIITVGPVLLPYDMEFLGADRRQLTQVSPHLVGFLRHDRVTLAGVMIAIGLLYAGLGWGGMRRGHLWARQALLASGAVGFPTLLLFLGFGFFDPLHGLVTAALVPFFALAVWPRRMQPEWVTAPEGPESERRRALLGQLLMITCAVGLLIGGFAITMIDLRGVFVASDLEFLGTTAEAIRAANPHLPGFVAHDRAGFGGAVMSMAVGLIPLSAWGWRRGAAWVWWTLAGAAAFGFGMTLIVHAVVGYLDFRHLAPVGFAAGLAVVALWLARPYLCAPVDDPRVG